MATRTEEFCSAAPSHSLTHSLTHTHTHTHIHTHTHTHTLSLTHSPHTQSILNVELEKDGEDQLDI